MQQLPVSRKQLSVFAIALALLVGGILAVIGIRTIEGDPSKLAAASSETTLPVPSPADMAATYGGLSRNAAQQALITRVGTHLAGSGDLAKLGRNFNFYLLADEARINAFAMPDGSIFLTTLMLNHLKTEGQLASLLAREIAHVVSRDTPKYLVTGILAYSETQERTADVLAVHYLAQAGYDPRSLDQTLALLGALNAQAAIEFFATHPGDTSRSERIADAIAQQFPHGVPAGLSQ